MPSIHRWRSQWVWWGFQPLHLLGRSELSPVYLHSLVSFLFLGAKNAKAPHCLMFIQLNLQQKCENDWNKRTNDLSFLKWYQWLFFRPGSESCVTGGHQAQPGFFQTTSPITSGPVTVVCDTADKNLIPFVWRWNVCFLSAGWGEVIRVHPKERADSVDSLLLAS